MRSLPIAAATVLMIAVFGGTAHADWCAVYRNGGNNCGFQTFQQCMATVSGVGGFCNVSPYSSSQKSARPQRTSNAVRETRREPQRETRREAERETKREAQRETKRDRIHRAKAKAAPQLAKRPLPSEDSAGTRGTKFSPGDDDHIIPAEPD
jgi:Protein of unknown function (DUF3551)